MNLKQKTSAILKFIFDMIRWVSFYPLAIILWPLIYSYSHWIRAKYDSNPLARFLWYFMNTGKKPYFEDEVGEQFTIANVDVSPDWYLIKNGYSIENPPTKWQAFVISYKWNVMRNYADNFLNHVIGFSGQPRFELNGVPIPRYNQTSRWFRQLNSNGEWDYRFYWRYESKFIYITLGSLESRYSVHLRFPFLTKK